MHQLFERATTYLQVLGADAVDHSGRTLIEHLQGTHAILSVWQQPATVCMAGLLHSVYGTASGHQLLQRTPTRQEVQQRFGPAIEGLVFGYAHLLRSQVAAPDAPCDALHAQLAIIYLANLVDQAIYLPRRIAPVLGEHLQSVRAALPPVIEEWMTPFMMLLQTALEQPTDNPIAEADTAAEVS